MPRSQEIENKQILNAYRGILRSMKNRTKENTKTIRRAFNMAVEAHKNDRRKSGEPYIFHPIAVARICSEEIGLSTTSVVCALLHDTVEDTAITLNDIELAFGKKVRGIIDGLTKMSGVFDVKKSSQAENFRKMLLTIPEDIRVIIIKLADRLHNMRTLDSMKYEKQQKIASETTFLYAPLAHRLGLNAVKTELEDLSFKYANPDQYDYLTKELKKDKPVRERFIRKFCNPLKKQLDRQDFKYIIKGRTKSVNSINRKLQKKGVDFEEVFDVFAIRIIINSTSENEKSDCWKAYSIVTDHYLPNPDRLRDWISHPKQNGYESLHTTVMSPTGKWVEVQIRTKRMDEIAEKGLAAHWKYKTGSKNANSGFDRWLTQVRELLENKDKNTEEFMEDFKANLYTKEIFVFTPRGDLFTLAENATALDFAFAIHTDVGATCMGAKINSKLVPLNYKLKSGEQIEIITSKNQRPKKAWLDFAVTSKAKSKIKQSLKEDKKKVAEQGKEILKRKLSNLKVSFDENTTKELLLLYNLKEHTEMYFQIANGKLDLSKIKSIIIKGGKLKYGSITTKIKDKFESLITKVTKSNADILIGDDANFDLDYKLAQCCNPLPGDRVFGFVTINDGIKIHRNSCPNAKQLRANYAYRIITADWRNKQEEMFITGVKFTGIDNLGIVNELTTIISNQESINMKSIKFDTNDGVFEGEIMLFVYDNKHLENLISKLKDIHGMRHIVRLNIID